MNNDTVIKTKSLTKEYAGINCVDNLSLNIKKGRVYGFLGPNGAGKTTTMKMLLDLAKPTTGKIEILGKQLNKDNRNEILLKIGNIIENPSYYGHLTGSENINLIEKMLDLPKGYGFKMLKLVGLENDATKKVKNYSLGMKQRLAIAMALVRKPEVLILDEPTNGLDPAGTKEIRELLIKLAHEQGITVMVSSHLLGEVEKTADDIGIINKGKLVFEGTIEELDEIRKPTTVIKTGNNEKVLDLLEPFKPKLENDSVLIEGIDNSVRAELIRNLVNNKIEIYTVSETKKSLEDLFLDITEGGK